MGNSDSETELRKKKKGKKDSDKDSEDERKEMRDREKEERKAMKDREKEMRDREKEERKARMDREKEERDREKEERKAMMDREKEERKAMMDREKEQRDREKEERKARMDEEKEQRKAQMDREKEQRDREKERRDREKEERDRERERKKKHKHYEDEKEHLSGSGAHAIDVHDGKVASYYNSPGGPSQPSQSHSGEVPWFLRESDTKPTNDQPSRAEPDFPIRSPPPQYSFLPPSQQQSLRVAGNLGGPPTAQNVPPSGYRIPLGPNVQISAPDSLGRPPATDFDGSTPVFIGSAIFPNSVHPCKVVPSLSPSCRVLYGGSEVGHHGRYDLLPITEDMEWVPTEQGEIPAGRRPVEGGYESNGNKLYHALGFVQGIHVPGKAGLHFVSKFESRLREEL